MADRRYRGRAQDPGDLPLRRRQRREDRRLRPIVRTRKSAAEVERYERAAKVAMEIAIKISDDLLRDAAVRQIVELCLKANDTRTARPLFRAIQSKSIIEDVLREHPSLGE